MRQRVVTGRGRARAIVWRLALALVLSSVALGLAASTHSLSTRIEQVLRGRFEKTALAANDDIAGIIVLGGNIFRIEEAARLASRFPRARMILSGPSPGEIELAASFPSLAGKLAIDEKPQSTFENALYSRELATPQPGERWLLVTSYVHMPRAVGVFRMVGFNVEPWPMEDRATAALRAATAWRELGALVLYRLGGRTDALLPAP